MLQSDDAVNYGTSSSRLGAEAEELFGKLVPHALPANKLLEKNCPSFDFDVYGITVDVKFGAVRSNGAWGFKTDKRKQFGADFYACFFTEEASLQNGYRCFLIPCEHVGHLSSVNLKPDTKSWLWDYEIDPENLSDIFMQMKEDV